MSATIETMDDAEARRALKAELDRHNIHVHQPDDPPLFTRTPSSTMQPMHWRWADLTHLLKRIGADLIGDSGGQRRTLRLANPGLPFGTTPTIWCSIQYILPGEIAGAHRHAANAMRFIIQGEGAKSTVDGEQYPFREGDLVMTPSPCWHDHIHEGAEPMVWVDILDISLVRSLHAVFFDPFPQRTQPIGDIPERSYLEYGGGLMKPHNPTRYDRRNPLLVYPAETAFAALERAAGLASDPIVDTMLEYQNPVDAGPVTTTMGARLLRLRPGFEGRAIRHTGSKVYHVVRGQGVADVGDQRFEWSKNDFISIPPWTSHALANPSAEPTVLFEVNDLPTLKALDLYHEDTWANA